MIPKNLHVSCGKWWISLILEQPQRWKRTHFFLMAWSEGFRKTSNGLVWLVVPAAFYIYNLGQWGLLKSGVIMGILPPKWSLLMGRMLIIQWNDRFSNGTCSNPFQVPQKIMELNTSFNRCSLPPEVNGESQLDVSDMHLKTSKWITG